MGSQYLSSQEILKRHRIKNLDLLDSITKGELIPLTKISGDLIPCKYTYERALEGYDSALNTIEKYKKDPKHNQKPGLPRFGRAFHI